MSGEVDVVCVGAGIIGAATAMTLAARHGVRVALVEAEREPATHQSGRNSGVVHSGLYYEPGSLKARNCVAGRRRLLEFCEREEIPLELCGKLVVATHSDQVSRLDELERRGRANGLQGLERVSGERIAEFEPHARGMDALWVPETGIVDYRAVTEACVRRFLAAGGETVFAAPVRSIETSSKNVVVTAGDRVIQARGLVACAGLQSDRVARLGGLSPRMRIIPFRGEYFTLRPDRSHLLRGLIYPVPDPRFPFLGIHLTRRIDGSIEVGPNAVLALRRDGYKAPRSSLRDGASALLYPGLWRLGLRAWRVAGLELLRAGSPRRFTSAVREFLPEIVEADLTPGGCGIRAQAIDARGRLIEDFRIERGPRSLHVLNAPSPAATASLAIADQVAALAADHFDLSSPIGYADPA